MNISGPAAVAKPEMLFYAPGDLTVTFEQRLLVGCLMTTRNKYLQEGKSTEDVNSLILKIIDAPSKKLRVIEETKA